MLVVAVSFRRALVGRGGGKEMGNVLLVLDLTYVSGEHRWD